MREAQIIKFLPRPISEITPTEPNKSKAFIAGLAAVSYTIKPKSIHEELGDMLMVCAKRYLDVQEIAVMEGQCVLAADIERVRCVLEDFAKTVANRATQAPKGAA